MDKVQSIFTLSPDAKNAENEPEEEIKKKDNTQNILPLNFNPFLQPAIEENSEEEKEKNDKNNNLIDFPPAYIKTKKPIINSPNFMLNKKKASQKINLKFSVPTKANTFNEKDIKEIKDNNEDNFPSFGTGDNEDFHNKATSVGVNIKKNKK